MLELELHFPHFPKNEETDRAQEAAILTGRSDVKAEVLLRHRKFPLILNSENSQN